MALPRLSVAVYLPMESPTMSGTVDTVTSLSVTSVRPELFFDWSMDPTRIHDWRDIIFATLWIIITVTGIVCNSALFLAVAVSRSLQTRTNILVVNVLLADVVVCCLLPLQSATLLLGGDQDNNGPLPGYVCAGVATLATVCLWSRMATFGVLSHQRWKQHTKSRSIWASIHKRKRPMLVATLTWVCPLVIVLVPSIVTECINVGYSNKTNLCIFEGGDESQLIFRIAAPLLWLLAVLFSLRNYYRIHIHERNRRANKYVPRKKRRPNPRRDPEAYMTPNSPFEEVQLARPVLSFKKGKGKSRQQSDQETRTPKKVSKSPKFVDFSRGKRNKSKPEKRTVLGRDAHLASNHEDVRAVDRELMLIFSRRENDSFRPSNIRRKSENEEREDKSEIDERNERNQERNSGKMRLKINSFVQKIPWKKSSTETMISAISREDIIDIENDCDDDEDDDDDGVIDEIVMDEAENSASMTMYSSPNYNVNKTRMQDRNQSVPSFELQPIGSSRVSSSRSSQKKSPPSDFVLSVSQVLSLLTLVYLVLIFPKLICPLLPSCSPIFYKLAETVYVSLSALNPLLLVFKHQDFGLVTTGLVYRRWKDIPQPSRWIVRLCRIEGDSNDYGDGDCQL